MHPAARHAIALLTLLPLILPPRCHRCGRRRYSCAPHHAARFQPTCQPCRRR